MDMKLEVVAVPVSDVDRSKEFYTSPGWRLDADVATVETFCVVPLTQAPGSAHGLHLVVDDVLAAHDELAHHGAEATDVIHDVGGVFHHGGTEGRVAGTGLPS